MDLNSTGAEFAFDDEIYDMGKIRQEFLMRLAVVACSEYDLKLILRFDTSSDRGWTQH